MADDNLVLVEFGAKIDKLVDATEQVQSRLQHLSNSADSIGSGFTRLGEIIVAAFSIEKIVAFVEKMADLGLQTERAATMLGTSVENIVQLSGVAKLTGTSMESLTMGIERLSLNVQRSTRDGLNPQAQALAVLGLRAKDLIGLDAPAYFDKLREAVSKFNPSLNLTNAVMAVGSRGIAQMMPMLIMAGVTYAEFKKRIDDASDGLARAVPGMAETHVNLTILGQSVQSLGARIFSVLKPAIDLIVTSFTSWIQKLDSKTIKEYATALIDVLGKAVIGLIGIFYEWGGVLDTLLEKLKKLLIGAAIGGTIGILGGGAGVLLGAIGGAGIAAAWDMFTAENEKGGEKAKADIAKQQEELVARVQAMMKAIADAIAGGSGHGTEPKGGRDAGAINELARQQIEAQIATIRGSIALWQGWAAQQKVIYQNTADAYQMTEHAKLQATFAATEQSYIAERDKMEKIVALYKNSGLLKEAAAEQQKIYLLDQTFATARIQLYGDMMRNMKAKFDDAFGALQGAFNSQLRGLLAGTTTWAQAFKSILGDMIIYFIQFVEKLVFQWIAGKLAMLVVDKTMATESAAAAIAGSELALPAKIASFTSDIMASSARTFAGVFAFLAPFMGPAAAGPAAASQATVLAELANVPKFEFGTDFVPYTGLAIVHKGEKITPASQNMGAASGGGGNETHLHVHAIDGASVARFFKNNADLISRTLGNRRAVAPSMA